MPDKESGRWSSISNWGTRDVDLCREAFLEEWKKSPYNKWNNFIIKWQANKVFRAGWHNYMGMPVPYSVLKLMEYYYRRNEELMHAWFSIGYLRGMWYIEGNSNCECCGKPMEIVFIKKVSEDDPEAEQDP